MNIDPSRLSAEDRAALLRWRLALGGGAEEQLGSGMALDSLGAGGASTATVGVESERLGDLDRALGFVYNDGGGFGRAPTRPYVPDWLAALRGFFSHDVVALVQKDAIERKGMTQLLLEPETLPYLEKNVDLVATLLSARSLIPEAAKDAARAIVKEVVDDLRKQLETTVRSSVIGALRRDRSSPLKVLKNLDWKRTIRTNLKGWDRERKVLVPERLHFWANQRRHHEWEVSILVDQSGSMAVSVVYSSIMAAIFASLDVLKTHLAFFNHEEIVDMTPLLNDPVEVLFSTQLGGAEDLNRAVAFAEVNYIQQPAKTILLLITDLYDTMGDTEQLVLRMRRLVESRVKALVLVKLSDEGRPSFNHELAQRLTEVGVHCFGCTPKLLVDVMARIMKGQEIASLVTPEGKR